MSSTLLKAGLLVGSTLLSLALAEGALRLVDGGALPQLSTYEAAGGARIRLRAESSGTAALARRHRYTIHTGPLGERVASPGDRGPVDAWLVLGDSQALGLGVAWEESFLALSTSAGVPLVSISVPSFGVEDALAHGRELLGRTSQRGVLVVVNQANDWDEVGAPIADRVEVVGGWLVPRDRLSGWQRAFFGSWWSRLHLPHYAAVIVSSLGASHDDPRPLWARDAVAASEATAEMASAIRDFAASIEVEVVVAYVPLDIAVSEARSTRSPFGRLLAEQQPWREPSLGRELSRQLGGLPLIDLSDALRDQPDAFLDGDYHLSPDGHRRVAEALAAALRR